MNFCIFNALLLAHVNHTLGLQNTKFLATVLADRVTNSLFQPSGTTVYQALGIQIPSKEVRNQPPAKHTARRQIKNFK